MGTISFIPPDGEFELMSYRLSTQVRPLIWIEAVVEPHSHSRIEYMIKAKSQFKQRSCANNVEILIPVPPDASAPSFKTSIGSVNMLRRRMPSSGVSSSSREGRNISCVLILAFLLSK